MSSLSTSLLPPPPTSEEVTSTHAAAGKASGQPIQPEVLKRILEDLTGLAVELIGEKKAPLPSVIMELDGDASPPRDAATSSSKATFEVERMEMFPQKENTVFEAEGRLTAGTRSGKHFSVRIEVDRSYLRKTAAGATKRSPRLSVGDVRSSSKTDTVHFVLEPTAAGTGRAGCGTIAVGRN